MSASGPEAEVHFGVPEDDFTLISGEPKEFHYISHNRARATTPRRAKH